MSRRAAQSDVPAIVEMMRKFHKHNSPQWAFDEQASQAVIADLIESPQGFVAIGDGFIAGVIQPNPISPQWLIAKEFLWWSEGNKGLALLKAFREWAKSMGASEIQMSCPVGSRAEKAFARHGPAQEIIYSEFCHVY